MAFLDESEQVLSEECLLIENARNGDRDSFAVLIERYWDRLYRWMVHLTHNRHAAEDLTQETFLKALAALASFKEGSNFRAWIFRIGYNSYVNQRRRAARVRDSFPEHLLAVASDPAEQAMSREALRLLARAVGRLPDDFRAAFLLRVEENLSFRDIADALETSEETARWRVFKARQKLMKVLAPRLEQEKS